MAKKFQPLDLSYVKTYSLLDRKSKVKADDFARIWQKGSSFRVFLDSMPDILAGLELSDLCYYHSAPPFFPDKDW